MRKHGLLKPRVPLQRRLSVRAYVRQKSVHGFFWTFFLFCFLLFAFLFRFVLFLTKLFVFVFVFAHSCRLEAGHKGPCVPLFKEQLLPQCVSLCSTQWACAEELAAAAEAAADGRCAAA